ncbi:magnesium transporter [Egbenema bharatensis]|uniref:magnesium transporter n=1 Tax=Egbenema bharatensis TaxID=3463334 RepID=UPI003A87B782
MTDSQAVIPAGSRSELRHIVREQLKLLLEQKNYEGVKSLLVPVQPVDIAEAIEELPQSTQILAFRLLKKQEAIEVYEYLSPEVQQSLLQEFRDQEAIDIVESMAPDDRANLFDELPAKLVRRVLSQLPPEEREATALLLGYKPGTAGRMMTPEYISIRDNLTASQAQERIRRLAEDREVAYYVYVTGDTKKLVGTISLRDLILASPDQPIREVMTTDVIYADTDTDQEEVARLIQRYDLLALPIVDHEQLLLGVVTIDDVLDVVQQEATEDIYTMGGVQADKEDNYFEIKFPAVVRRRIPWLMVLILTNIATVFILSNYEAVLDEVVALAFFTPLLIDTGGNVGAQSSTVVIRGLGTDELRYKKPVWVVIRETLAGASLGIILGVIVIGVALAFVGQAAIAFTVAISLLIIAVLAATVGAMLPFVFHRLGFDPALMSAPFITTIVDILGILAYLNVAKLFLGI